MLAAVALLVAAIVLYNFFFKSEAITVPSESAASAIGEDLIKIRGDLQKVTLDQTIFSSPGYLLLIDFSTEIPKQATGRSNPFDIIGRD